MMHKYLKICSGRPMILYNYVIDNYHIFKKYDGVAENNA